MASSTSGAVDQADTMVSAPVQQQQKLRIVKQPNPPKLKDGEVIVLPDYCESINEGGYFKEYRKLTKRYKLLGMTDRQFNYIRIVTRAQQGPGLPYIGLEAIADEMGKSYFTAYEIRKELIEADFLIIRNAYHPEHQKMVQVHDLTPFYQMNIGLDEKELNKEAVSIYRAIRENRAEIGRQAAQKRYEVEVNEGENGQVEEVEDATKQRFMTTKNAILRQLKSLKMRLIENARNRATGQPSTNTDFGETQAVKLAQNKTEIESNNLESSSTIYLSNLSKPGKEEVFGNQSPTGYTNQNDEQSSTQNSTKSRESTPNTNDETITTSYRKIENQTSSEGGAKQSSKRETNYKGPITFFRTRFPAKACLGEKKAELFPLSQNDASYE